MGAAVEHAMAEHGADFAQAGIRAYQRGDSTTLIIFIGIVVVTILVYYFKDKK